MGIWKFKKISYKISFTFVLGKKWFISPKTVYFWLKSQFSATGGAMSRRRWRLPDYSDETNKRIDRYIQKSAALLHGILVVVVVEIIIIIYGIWVIFPWNLNNFEEVDDKKKSTATTCFLEVGGALKHDMMILNSFINIYNSRRAA